MDDRASHKDRMQDVSHRENQSTVLLKTEYEAHTGGKDRGCGS